MVLDGKGPVGCVGVGRVWWDCGGYGEGFAFRGCGECWVWGCVFLGVGWGLVEGEEAEGDNVVGDIILTTTICLVNEVAMVST